MNTAIPTSYIDVLAAKYPQVQVTSIDGGYEYEYLTWISGDPIPAKEVLDVIKLDMDRDRVWRKIQEIRDQKKSGGVKVGTNWFHSDDTSRIQQIGLVMMGANLPVIQWKTLGNTYVTMTPTLAQQIFMTTASNDSKIFGQAETHRLNMLSLPNPFDYDYSGGWQLVFGE